MLLYSPNWLFLAPGLLLLLLGLAGMITLAGGPVTVLGRTWQIHTMLAFVAATLVGAQLVQLWVFARTYARVQFGERDPLLERLGRVFTLERGILAGAVMAFMGVAILAWISLSWAFAGFGALSHEYSTAFGVTLVGLGTQVVFGSFFVGLLTMRVVDDTLPRGVVVAEGTDAAYRLDVQSPVEEPTGAA